MVLLGAVAVVWSLSQKRFAHAFVLAGWLHLGLFAVRNMPIYLILAAPIVAMTLHELLLRLGSAPLAPWIARTARTSRSPPPASARWTARGAVHAVSAAGFLADRLAVLRAVRPRRSSGPNTTREHYPVKALEVHSRG